MGEGGREGKLGRVVGRVSGGREGKWGRVVERDGKWGREGMWGRAVGRRVSGGGW